MTMSLRTQRRIKSVLWYVLLTAVALVVLFPLWSAFTISMLRDTEVASYPPRLFPSALHLTNFRRALEQAPLLRYLFNSVVQSSTVMLGQMITASLAAFAFAFINFKGRQVVFLIFLSTLMIPWEATIIPNYLTIRSLGWTDTYIGLSAPFLATAFGTFLLRQFFLSLPREVEEAAWIDGCSRWRILLTIVLPLARPALATVAVITFLLTWNDVSWPAIAISSESHNTLPLGIASFKSRAQTNQAAIMAANVLATMPVLIAFLAAQRTFVRSLASTAVKG